MTAGIPACEAAIAKCSWNNATGLADCVAATEDCNLAEMIPYQSVNNADGYTYAHMR